jgi:hypothetical protein
MRPDQSVVENPPGLVRYLGAFEEVYWLYNQLGAHGFAYAMEVDGATTVLGWRNALAKLQRSQPFFSVCIEPNKGSIPFFRHTKDAPIPLRVVDAAADIRWQDEWEREVFTPFVGDAPPLVRAVLIHGPTRAVFILAAHHAISDGVSMTAALVDLFNALTGRPIESHRVLPSMEESLGVPRARLNEVLEAPQDVGTPFVYRGRDLHPPRIETLRLDATLTSLLVARARIENTTVHGALCSAVVLAGRKLTQTWRQKPVRVLSPMNIRKNTRVGNSSALYFLGAMSAIEPGNTAGFWALAGRFTTDLSKQRSAPALLLMANAMTQAVVQGLDVEGAKEFMAHGLPFEAVVSNVGRLDPAVPSGELEIRSVWGSAFLTGALDEQIIGAVTVNGQMHLTCTSQTPLPWFLSEVEAHLRNAVK